ncbi:Glucokinase [Bhargavaea cecembensis DSE10]|uniref:Glucokinase n=1 Tax=Bhargavaea cecembensis DSE10 TaxID=1235279 RepID=M7NWU2_9BACL|nr:ROK family protein [Bhargavaea cecembensis]EMR06125.1 Glucokinase [Bhargavaea cecembensis DSE10]
MKKEYVIGVDIGGTNVAVGITDLEGNLLASASFPSQGKDGELFGEIRQTADRLMVEHGIPEEKILGVGAGVPGFTDPEKGLVTEAPALGWKDFPVGEKLRAVFPYPVAVDNDVNVATLGEQWIGHGRGKSDFIYISLGTGIGSGVVVNGKLLRGSRFSAGEIGYMVTDRHEAHFFAPTIKGYGFLESAAGGAAIGDALSDELGRRVTAEDAFRMYRNGNQAAIGVVTGAFSHLGIAVANAASLLDPEVIVIGGGLAKASDIILPAISRTVDHYAPNRCEIVRTALGEESGVIGAAALLLGKAERV